MWLPYDPKALTLAFSFPRLPPKGSGFPRELPPSGCPSAVGIQMLLWVGKAENGLFRLEQGSGMCSASWPGSRKVVGQGKRALPGQIRPLPNGHDLLSMAGG